MYETAGPAVDDERTNLAAADGPPALAVPYDATHLGAKPLRTERMVLRPLLPTDADDVYEYQRLPEVLRFIPWPERDREEGRQHTEKRAAWRTIADDDDALIFAMVLVGEPSVSFSREGVRGDRVIGDLMVRVSSAEHAQVEIGWVLHPAFQGRGLAFEGAREVLRFAFESLNAHRVQALLASRNLASAALCERLGMRREGTMVEEEYHYGEWEDTAVYGILRREWAAAADSATAARLS
ncbi:GNAT family N-acetyltransferase [Agromyces albus]|uniref:N-acetyltransferase n=1 Tax=Agromyces albus TaxID=205332 RepID=A0A4Q2L6D6_9MICO|nr:GNAT family protein [Agromyces albus]RXZ73289.1 N-acetyltransferase [Agromyces albus]